jgi:acetyl esterase/lipase
MRIIAGIVEFFGRLFVFNTFKPRAASLARDMAYGSDDEKKQSLDIIGPPSGAGPFPAVVYIHGGGFMCMDKRSYRRISHSFASDGFVVFNINYRLAPKAGYEEILRDVSSAVLWVHKNAGDYGADPSQIFLAGDSAGAFLAAWYAAALSDPAMLDGPGIEEVVPHEAIAGLLLYYGVYDWGAAERTWFPLRFFIRVMGESFFGEDAAAYPERCRATAPMLHAGCDFPPTLVVSGGVDPIASQSRAFAAHLRRKGVHSPALLLRAGEHPGSIHAFLNVWFLKCARVTMARSKEFMREALLIRAAPGGHTKTQERGQTTLLRGADHPLRPLYREYP